MRLATGQASLRAAGKKDMAGAEQENNELANYDARCG